MRAIAALVIGLSLLAAVSACKKAPVGAADADMTLGAPQAKVTVLEYASVACPICAKWNNEVFPAFKAKYVDTGKVQYVAREMLTHDPAAAAAGFLLARCAGKDKYFQITDAIYRQQADMFPPDGSNHAREVLLRVAESAGFTEPQFDACVTNDAALNALNQRIERESKQYSVEATPTFVINGAVNSGFQTLADLDKAIAQAQAAAK
jgi:protein-disulfide isomerase